MFPLLCGLGFALGVWLGHRVMEWLEGVVFRFWNS